MEIRTEHLTKEYGQIKALDDVCFTAVNGSITAVIGPSGAGKTTLLRCICGLIRPDQGKICFDGIDSTDQKPQERGAAMIFQSAALFPETKVADNIAWGLRRLGYEKQTIRDMVDETASLLHISHLLGRYPEELSAGEKQRAGIARAIIRKPRILLMDEPFANLDVRLSDQLQKEIIDLQKQYGMTMILVTHDQEEAMNMADTVCLMNGGKLVSSGTARELFENPPDLFTAQFIGSPAINLIPKGTPLFAMLKERYAFADEVSTVGIRAHNIQFTEGFAARVCSCRIHAGMYLCEIACGNEILRVLSPKMMNENEMVSFSVKPDSLYLFEESGKTV